MTTSEEMICEESAIQNFYNGANIFITGGTGFMGKVMLEKLLRSCPKLNNIYLLMRGKKGKDADTRIQELFEDPLFEKMKSVQPDFKEKIRIILGDCSEPDLGIKPGDQQRIQEHVNIVFHMAATIKFDEKLQTAIPINVQAIRDLLRICKDCSNLKAVVHISTAYSHCYYSYIEEKFYDSPITCENTIKMVECLSDDILTSITPKLLDKWPNTYTFTKAIAENTVKTHGKGLPAGVFRPSMVACTRSDPVQGWIDNMNGPNGAVAGIGIGLIHVIQVDRKLVVDIIPCDMVVSAVIATAWDIHERKRSGGENIPVYNYVSSCENPIIYDEYISRGMSYGWEVPSNRSVWTISLTPIKSYFIYKICTFLLHTMPAMTVDIILYIVGRKPMILKLYEKLHKYLDTTAYFRLREWKFSNQNVQLLWRRMNSVDQRIFDFNIGNINWDEYCKGTAHGARMYLAKEDPKTIPEAVGRRNRLYWIHQAIKFAFISLLLWLFWTIISSILFLAADV